MKTIISSQIKSNSNFKQQQKIQRIEWFVELWPSCLLKIAFAYYSSQVNNGRQNYYCYVMVPECNTPFGSSRGACLEVLLIKKGIHNPPG